MAYYLKRGKSFFVSSKEELYLHEALPVGTYTVQHDPVRGFYLEEIANFVDIPKHYGDNLRNTERIYTTFMRRAQSTGVMLNGEKGSGKSLLAKTLSIRGHRDNVPTIVINAPWHGDAFNKFVQSIDQPTILLFDEFEKVYSKEQQEEILTLLDGVYPSKKLFVLTCNDKWRVDYNMRNRPGRIFYMIDFKGLEPSFVREYCQENLDAKHHIDRTCDITALFSNFNFDMLKALVEEMNRYGEDPATALHLLNIKPEYDADRKFTVVLIVDGKTAVLSEHDANWDGNPLTDEASITYKSFRHGKNIDVEGDDDEFAGWKEARFTSSDLAQVDAHRGVYIFKNEQGQIMTLTRAKMKAFNYLAA